MQTEVKQRKVSLNEVGYRLTDVWDKFESGQMDDRTAMVHVKIGVAITNTFRTKALINDFNGVKNDINDMFSDTPKKLFKGALLKVTKKGKDVVIDKMIE